MWLKKNNYSAFTLIELLIVMSILVIIGGMSFAAYQRMQVTIRLNEYVNTLEQDIRNVQREAMLLRKDKDEAWMYGMGMDLTKIGKDQERGKYSTFKWCSGFKEYGDPRTTSDIPGYDATLGISSAQLNTSLVNSLEPIQVLPNLEPPAGTVTCRKIFCCTQDGCQLSINSSCPLESICSDIQLKSCDKRYCCTKISCVEQNDGYCSSLQTCSDIDTTPPTPTSLCCCSISPIKCYLYTGIQKCPAGTFSFPNSCGEPLLPIDPPVVMGVSDSNRCIVGEAGLKNLSGTIIGITPPESTIQIQPAGASYILFESVTGRAFFYDGDGKVLNYNDDGELLPNPTDLVITITPKRGGFGKKITVKYISGKVTVEANK